MKDCVRLIKTKKTRMRLEYSLTPYHKYLKVGRDSMKVLRKTGRTRRLQTTRSFWVWMTSLQGQFPRAMGNKPKPGKCDLLQFQSRCPIKETLRNEEGNLECKEIFANQDTHK